MRRVTLKRKMMGGGGFVQLSGNRFTIEPPTSRPPADWTLVGRIPTKRIIPS